MVENILTINNRNDFRKWLENNSQKESECYLILKRGKPVDSDVFYYLDAVEEALCFGWIDSSLTLIDGVRYQRFNPRSKKSIWSELNKERVRRLEKLGLMTDYGRKVLPNMDFIFDDEIKNEIVSHGLMEQFTKFPELYQRIRAYNLSFTKHKLPKEYSSVFQNFLKHTANGKMYGEWNDYGRLINY